MCYVTCALKTMLSSEIMERRRIFLKEEDIFSNCWLLGPLKESMFLWVQLILLVVSETPANISITYTLRTATAGKVYLCCLFQGRILLPIQNE